MLKNIKYYFAALVLMVGPTSCLEKLPGSSIPEGEAMQTFSDAEQVVTGIYAGLKSSALFSGSLTVMPDIQADLVYAVENFTNVYGSVWQWDILSTDSDVESVYAALYTIIARCNFYLDSIGEVMANELDVTNLGYLETYTGEVYTIRALCYSKLLECFCKAYDPATAENELGVVLRTKYSEPEPMKRASLKDSYDLVIDDLEHAEEYLDNDFDQYNSIYVTAAAAQALHARVALYMQDWQTAIDYATMLIENDAFELADGTKSYSSTDTYLTYMWNYDSSYEIIWELGFTTTSYGGALGQVFLNADRDYKYTYPDYVPAQWVLDAYTDNDLRYDAYFYNYTTGYANGLTWPLLIKYFGNRNLISSANMYMYSMPKLFRLSEQYLIRAEAYCNLPTPNYAAASKDLTALRAKRFSGGAGAITVSSSNWLQTISEERVRELYMEGFRLNDLKRWHMGFERKPQTNSLAEGSSLKIEADDGSRCLREWPTGIYKHTGLRGLFLGSNDLRKIDDTISYMIYNLDISDNPNITFDASEICYYWQAGAFNLIYDKTQNIVNCPEMLE